MSSDAAFRPEDRRRREKLLQGLSCTDLSSTSRIYTLQSGRNLLSWTDAALVVICAVILPLVCALGLLYIDQLLIWRRFADPVARVDLCRGRISGSLDSAKGDDRQIRFVCASACIQGGA